MPVEFPCGSKGEANFCPDLCQFGKFCKVKDQFEAKPRGLPEESEEKQEEKTDEKISVYF